MLALAACCACVAVLLATEWAPSCTTDRMARGRARPLLRPGEAIRGPRARRPVSVLLAVAAALLLGGAPGVVAAVVIVLVLPAALGRLETGEARRIRRELVRSAPLVADLMASALTAGVPIDQAIPVIARAVGGPAGALLLEVDRRLALGESATLAWKHLEPQPGLGAVARTIARSVQGGAPAADLLARAAEDLRVAAHAEVLAEVRAVSVRAVLPLGLCLLPAFVLLGVVPIVGGLLPSL